MDSRVGRKDIEIMEANILVANELMDIAEGVSAPSCPNLDMLIDNNPEAKDMICDIVDNSSTISFEGMQNDILRMNKAVRSKVTRGRIRRIDKIIGVAAIVGIAIFLIFDFGEPNELPIVAEREVIGEIKYTPTEPTFITAKGEVAVVEESSQINKVEELRDVATITKEIDIAKPVDNCSRYLVPAKCTSSIELSDGTIVHLNAGSELVFPEHFNGENRVVTLKGEGYFDVAKSDKHFVVKVNGVEVKVYGTKFNVNAYESGRVITTLLSGSVSVQYNKIDTLIEKRIRPNQQLDVSTLNGSSKLYSEIDGSRYIQWLGDYFVYNAEPVIAILREMANWYGVQFIYTKGVVESLILSGTINRNTSLEDVLEIIELSSNIKFRKEGDILYVERCDN